MGVPPAGEGTQRSAAWIIVSLGMTAREKARTSEPLAGRRAGYNEKRRQELSLQWLLTPRLFAQQRRLPLHLTCADQLGRRGNSAGGFEDELLLVLLFGLLVIGLAD